MSVLELGPWDLVVAACLVLLAGGVSVVMRLGLERKLAVASLRTVVQLLLIGQVLRHVFAFDHPLLVLAVLAVMIVAASRAAVNRPSRTFAGANLFALLTLAVTGLAITGAVTQLVIGVHPWYHAQYVIPLLGMLLGNSLTGLSLAMDHFLERLDARRDEVETDLALGATRWEAAKEPMAEAVRRGMIPMINAMMVVGVVSLPGMMTGQILAGQDPMGAVKYQIVVMFMLAASTALASMAMTWLMFRRLFDVQHRLRRELIRRT
ncbi:MAG: iron export ABC transporter permease subunit FetB [Myxococcales bacterium]|nr:iron export ABC transporter permease subunit FetB [Myxococcales bacterium]MCB9651161.1 iron export ABC transporter permease subunit FetB [Deltaproteobacteria bacterium]